MVHGQIVKGNNTEQALRRIERTLHWQNLKLNLLIRLGVKMMSELSDAIDAAELAAEADAAADSAASTLLVTLSDLVKAAVANSTDPAATARVRAVADSMKARADALGAAVVANTPAAEPA